MGEADAEHAHQSGLTVCVTGGPGHRYAYETRRRFLLSVAHCIIADAAVRIREPGLDIHPLCGIDWVATLPAVE
jgi:hypothetical protein